MAGLKGNVAWWAAAKQSAGRGTPATVATIWTPFTDGNIMPSREIGNLQETDSARDQGISYVQRSGVEGAPSAYARDDVAHKLLEFALGTRATTGTTPNYTHVLTPANTLPYVTLWRNLSDTLWERFDDCFVNELSFKSEAGNPLTVQTSVMGRQATRLTADPSAASAWVPLTAPASSSVYNFNDATVTLAGGATSLVDSFELTIQNGVNLQQTDDVIPYDLTPGQRIVNLSFDLIFENLTEYNKFHYGGAAGTAISSSIYTTAANFIFSHGANNSIAFDIPVLAYEEFSPEPNAGGDPIKVSVRAQAQRPNPVVTATVKNQLAT